MRDTTDMESADRRWTDCYERIEKIRDYEYDWNDDGAAPLSKEVTELAEAVLMSLQSHNQRPPDSCFATDEGHVIISWEDEQHYFEIEVDAKLRCTGRQLARGASRAESWELYQSDLPGLCLPVHHQA